MMVPLTSALADRMRHLSLDGKLTKWSAAQDTSGNADAGTDHDASEDDKFSAEESSIEQGQQDDAEEKLCHHLNTAESPKILTATPVCLASCLFPKPWIPWHSRAGPARLSRDPNKRHHHCLHPREEQNALQDITVPDFYPVELVALPISAKHGHNPTNQTSTAGFRGDSSVRRGIHLNVHILQEEKETKQRYPGCACVQAIASYWPPNHGWKAEVD
ncbi:hypothetical protein DFH27DRAFT_604590 [Peziza echinospora]|nr:hypothetical protein DFH27DRAFT_604590 [Peziza echinospora]